MKALANRTKHVVIIDDAEWVDVEAAVTVRPDLYVSSALTPTSSRSPEVQLTLSSLLHQAMKEAGELVTEKVDAYGNSNLVMGNVQLLDIGDAGKRTVFDVGQYVWHDSDTSKRR